ncbi:MAG: ABC transporter permease subunit [Gammaproteobacteria bacterium]
MNKVNVDTTRVPPLPSIPSYAPVLRRVKDRLARAVIALGGGGVIIAIMLIFCYLLYEVIPLFVPASMTFRASQSWTENEKSITSKKGSSNEFGLLDELGEVLVYWNDEGYVLMRRQSGERIQQVRFRDVISAPDNVKPRVVPNSVTNAPTFALLRPGFLELFDIQFDVIYPEHGGRQVVPRIQPTFESPLVLPDKLADRNSATRHSAINRETFTDAVSTFRRTEDSLAWAGSWPDGRVVVQKWNLETGLFDESLQAVADTTYVVDLPDGAAQKLLLGPNLRWLYAIQPGGVLRVYDLQRDRPAIVFTLDLPDQREITASQFLLGSVSLLLGDSGGRVSQIASFRNSDNTYQFAILRHFDLSDAAITHIESEQRRKGFVTVDANGQLFLSNTTSERVVLTHPLNKNRVGLPVLSPRADTLVMVNTAGIHAFDVQNKHPEVSWSSLWQKVWYEGYAEPDYLWQSSAANNDFEPKMSLVPLSFGTLKAAFYAMLLAMPLAICGAVFTAYFMAPSLRRKVKPAIELMEALPTVILGFLAGLWLAPLVEQNLVGIFSILFLTPLIFLLTAVGIMALPVSIRHRIAPPGWEPLVLIPALIVSISVSMSISDPIQSAFFGGDVSIWLRDEWGITYRQRNALVVGFAMGFAVIPTIFSIAEDAIFAVPKSLTQGSLALGASPWQTLVRVVLPTASPGIFSAVMIGFGRAVGETMIVLMATGNTPIMDFNIFEGFRTLSANIAVELPEAEVHSTHFRILFLAALVLFLFTFVLNTTAEYVRQRLREKYGSL